VAFLIGSASLRDEKSLIYSSGFSHRLRFATRWEKPYLFWLRSSHRQETRSDSPSFSKRNPFFEWLLRQDMLKELSQPVASGVKIRQYGSSGKSTRRNPGSPRPLSLNERARVFKLCPTRPPVSLASL